MSRVLRRVPLSFNWPLKKRWKGYINPYGKRSQRCTACEGTGYAPETKLLKDKWYGFNGEFNPSETGSKPYTVDHPIVRARAEHNIKNSPEYYGEGELAI